MFALELQLTFLNKVLTLDVLCFFKGGRRSEFVKIATFVRFHKTNHRIKSVLQNF
jgi:hypothetical protein